MPICLENKKLSTLLCGHNVCITCMHSAIKIKMSVQFVEWRLKSARNVIISGLLNYQIVKKKNA